MMSMTTVTQRGHMRTTNEDIALLNELKRMGVISHGRVYRWRLFSSEERRTILKLLPGPMAGPGPHVGMIDELEMVNFEVHGKELVSNSHH